RSLLLAAQGGEARHHRLGADPLSLRRIGRGRAQQARVRPVLREERHSVPRPGDHLPHRAPRAPRARGAMTMTLPEALPLEPTTVGRVAPRARARAVRPLRVVALGGGTGLPVVLRGLAPRVRPRDGRRGLELTAVVAMSDDGGSSGRLRRTRGVLPPGDVRNCLVALASSRGALAEVLQFRFGGRGSLAGHALGNLLLAALAEMHGDFLQAVRAASRLLEARGTVLPSTVDPVQLVAELEDGRRVLGERHLARAGTRVRRVSLHPLRPTPADGVLEAIAAADLVTLGPGSLYSSVLPNLLVD